MMDPAFRLARAALFRLDAETAHQTTLKALKAGLYPHQLTPDDPRLAVTVAGLSFPNPLGIAAGFDKNAEVPDAMLRMGFGFAEIGTVTPRAQTGNARPRVFRLVHDRGVINRLGFNNEGHEAALARLTARRGRTGIVGVNIGANKDTVDRAADYVLGVERFAAVASYFTVNISSPNTPGLRDLQARASLAELLSRVLVARDTATARVGRRVPVFLKVAPDLDRAGEEDVAAEAVAQAIDGLIVSNTTLDRAGLTDKAKAETGGLSGHPLFRRSTACLARFRTLVGPTLPIIGVGGVDSPEAALAKMAAGANLVQLYTGLVYEGPGLVARIKSHFAKTCDREGLRSIAEAVGVATDNWAKLDG
jgi:dihydroorotate dehydrogenase